MKKKLRCLSIWSFLLSLIIFGIAFVFYHYFTTDGIFTTIFQKVAGKPYVSGMFGVLGVLFLFSSIMSLIVSHIFFSDGDRETKK